MRVGHYEVEILVNGSVLKEYAVPEDDDDAFPEVGVGTKYIEAHENAEFVIRTRVLPSANWTWSNKAFSISIDGKYITGSVIAKNPHGGWRATTHMVSEVLSREAGRDLKRPFVFRNLTTTDEHHASKELLAKVKDLGKIDVLVNDYEKMGTTSRHEPLKEASQAAIPEKALKGQAIDMSAGLGAARSSDRTEQYAEGIWGPRLAHFCFKYRSRHALQMMGLIPTTPEPLSLHERDVNSLNLQETRQLLAEYREGDKNNRKVKPEFPTIKKEDSPASAISRKRRRIAIEAEGDENDDDDDDCRLIEVKRCRAATAQDAGVEVVDLS